MIVFLLLIGYLNHTLTYGNIDHDHNFYFTLASTKVCLTYSTNINCYLRKKECEDGGCVYKII